MSKGRYEPGDYASAKALYLQLIAIREGHRQEGQGDYASAKALYLQLFSHIFPTFFRIGDYASAKALYLQ